MAKDDAAPHFDFKGLGYSKVGHFKQVRSKIKELETLSRELAQRHSELEAIINNMTDGLTILDRKLNIVFVNKVQQSMFPQQPLLGRKCYQVFYRNQHACGKCPALVTMKKCKTLRGEMVIQKGEYAGHCIEWATTPVTGLSNHVDKIILLMRDITKRKEYEFNLMRADRMAAIGLLAAGIAHEINNPLTSIAGFSEGLLKRLNSIPEFRESQFFPYFQDYLQIINNEAYRCRDTIQSLIRFSQKSSDDHEILDLNQVIDDTVSLIRQHAKDNGIRINVMCDADSGKRRIVGNVSELKHMFLNLLNNILDTTEEGRVVTVFTKNTGGEVRVVISNAKEDMSVLRTGETLHPAQPTKPGVGGTPLSLSICYNIMQHHQGDIQVNHMPGRSSAFILKFPAAKA